MVFNKQIDSKKEYIKIRDKIQSQLGYYKHPKQLTEQDKTWLKDNIKQYDEKVLNEIIENSILPDKPKK
jgi:hypothetical protein